MTEQVPKQTKSKWMQWLLRAILILLLVLVAAYFLLQTSVVQNWVADKVTTQLSKKLDGKVSVGKVNVSLTQGVSLHDLSVYSSQYDSLLTVGKVAVGVNKSITSILQNELDLSDIELSKVHMKIVTKKGESKSNLDQVIEKLSSNEKRESTGDPLDLNLESVLLQDVNLSIIDENKSSQQIFAIEQAEVEINTFLKDNLLDVAKLSLVKPVVRLRKTGEAYELNTTVKEVEEIKEKSNDEVLEIKLGKLDITDGIFSLDDDTAKELGKADVLDYKHFEFDNVNLSLRELVMKELTSISLILDRLEFTDDKGFTLKELKADRISIDTSKIELSDFKLRSDHSLINHDIKLTFDSVDDFSDFEKKVHIYGNLENSTLYMGDLMHFIRSFNESAFFIKNKKKRVKLSGIINGPIDRLKGKNLSIKIKDDLHLLANFSTRNLTRKNRELINFGIKELRTDVDFLKEFIPGFNIPDNFYKLGDIDFKGRFDGYFKDFVAYGSVQTALGNGFLDMRLDVKDGSELANYSGELNLEDFDLKTWSGNDELGIVNFSASIEDGKGLTLNSVDTELNAIIESVSYKGYDYQDFIMDGHLSKNRFNGEFSISDDNIDLIFDGNIELIDSIPHLDFKADISNIDLYNLNLSKGPLNVKGNIDINGEGNSLDNVLGQFLASDLVITKNDTTYVLDTLNFVSALSKSGKKLSFYSDIGNVEMDGKYDLQELVPSFKSLLKKNYPHYTQSWKVKKLQNPKPQDVAFKIHISDTKNIPDLLGLREFKIQNLKGSGYLNTYESVLSYDGSLPELNLKGNTFSNTTITLRSKDERGSLEVTVDSSYIGGKSFNPITVKSDMVGDTVNFFVGTSEIADSLEKLEIAAQLIPHAKGYAVQFVNKEINMLGADWSFTSDNVLIFGEDYIEVNNLRLSDGSRSIILDDENNKGLSLYLADFDFKTADGFINYDKMRFAGKGDLSFYVSDIFSKENELSADLYIPQFTINGDPYGALELDVKKPSVGPAEVKVDIGEDTQGFHVVGEFDPSRENYIEADVTAKDFNLKIFEYILRDGITNVKGKVNLEGRVEGPLDDMDIDATASLDSSSLKVIYTGATYNFHNQKVRCTEDIIDFTGAKLVDSNGKEGVITGGIYHDLFTNFGLNANLSGNDVIAINTSKADNEVYYGFAKGDVSVDFTGPFEQIDMKIVCTTGPGTVINIPINDDRTASEKSFIEFVDSDLLFKDEMKEIVDFKIEGMDIELDLNMTEDAEVNLIFDESKGDIIKGRGRGALKVHITRTGDFDIYGNYTIAEGDYLFTAFGLVAKPFQVRRGGTIRWTGDPVNAELNIKADYQVRTPMRLFLNEYLIAGTDAYSQANSRTEVDLILDLGGTLYNPSVSFDLEFPNLTGEIASVAGNKMRALRTNQSELNNQVLGLIVFNTFLPSNSSGNTAGADLGAAGVSTLSEFLSSQLSIVFTGLINDALAEDGLIAGIDFEIGLNKNSFTGINQADNDILPDEIEVNLKNRFRFLDERLSLGLGGNYVRQSVLAINNNYFVGDFVIEYFLTSDRKLKLKMYGKYDYDENLISSSRRQKYGVGIGYRTEFGSLADLKSGLKDQIKEDLKGEDQ